MPEVPTTEEIRGLDDPPDRLIHAGARLLIDDGMRILAAGLSPEAVTEVAGRTRRTFYDHFDTKEEFTRSMLLSYLEVTDGIRIGDFDEAFYDLIFAADGDVVTSIRALSQAFFAPGTDSHSPQMQAIAWSVAHSDPIVQEGLRAYAEQLDHRYADLFVEAFRRWGLKLRPPWTPELLALSLRSMAAGLYARTRTGSEAIDHAFFADNILAYLAALTQPLHRPDETLDTAFRHLTRTSPAAWLESQDPQTAVNARQRVLDAIAPLLGELGMSAMTLDHIAHAAGVSRSAVNAAFSSIDDAVGQAVLQTLPALEREAAFDLDADLDCRAVLGRHFARLAGWATEHREFASYSLGAVAVFIEDSARTNFEDDSRATLRVIRSIWQPAVDILSTARTRGEVRTKADASDAAILTTHALIARALLNPSYSATKTADWIVELVFDGIGSSPRPDRNE